MSGVVAAAPKMDVLLPREHEDGSREEEPASPLCALCCEEELSDSSTVILSTCLHRSCRTCLVKWIEREESTGRRAPPSCPFCRAEIGEAEAFQILGRPFQPRLAEDAGIDEDDGAGELTLQWIRAHTVPCGGCGSFIEKSGGCDLIECLCGFRFCYACGTAGGECDCHPGHVFHNDVFERNDTYVDAPAVRDGNGVVDLAACMRRREVKLAREEERVRRAREAAHRWEQASGCCTSDGRWLFMPSRDAGSVRMLEALCGGRRVRDERRCRRMDLQFEECKRWHVGWNSVYVRDGFGAWPFSRIRPRGRIVIQPNLVDDSWLFLRRGEDYSALKQRGKGRGYRKKGKVARFLKALIHR